MNEEMIDELTKIYARAYTTALDITLNQELAVQIAVGVTTVVNMGMKADQENVKRRANGVPALYTMFMQVNKDKKDPGKEGHE